MTLNQRFEKEIARKVQSFAHWVSEGYSYTFAWDKAMGGSTFGPALRKQVEERCVAAGNDIRRPS